MIDKQTDSDHFCYPDLAIPSPIDHQRRQLRHRFIPPSVRPFHQLFRFSTHIIRHSRPAFGLRKKTAHASHADDTFYLPIDINPLQAPPPLSFLRNSPPSSVKSNPFLSACLYPSLIYRPPDHQRSTPLWRLASITRKGEEEKLRNDRAKKRNADQLQIIKLYSAYLQTAINPDAGIDYTIALRL